MKKWIIGCALAVVTLTASPASATYITVENMWPDGDTWTGNNLPTTGTTISFLNIWLTVSDTDGTKYDVLIGSSDYYTKQPHATPTSAAVILVDITTEHQIPAHGVFTSKKLIGLPDEGFLFGAGAAGISGYGPGFTYFTGATDPAPGHFQVIPGLDGSDSFYFYVYRSDGSTINVAKVTFHPGNPNANK